MFFNGIFVPGIPPHLQGTCVQETVTSAVFLPHEPAEPTMAAFLHRRPHTVNVQHPNETGHRLWATSLAAHLDPSGLETVGHARLTAAGLPVLGGVRALRRHDRKGTERIGRFVRSGRTRRGVRRSDRTDPYIYP
ncbi:hypothetical protein [Streptomyces sp. NPDC054765]